MNELFYLIFYILSGALVCFFFIGIPVMVVISHNKKLLEKQKLLNLENVSDSYIKLRGSYDSHTSYESNIRAKAYASGYLESSLTNLNITKAEFEEFQRTRNVQV